MMFYQLLQIFPVNQSGIPGSSPDSKIRWIQDFAKYLGLQQNFFYDLFSYIWVALLLILTGNYFYNIYKSKTK